MCTAKDAGHLQEQSPELWLVTGDLNKVSRSFRENVTITV